MRVMVNGERILEIVSATREGNMIRLFNDNCIITCKFYDENAAFDHFCRLFETGKMSLLIDDDSDNITIEER